MRQKQQFSSDLNIKVEPKEDVIFLGIKSRDSNLKRGENMKQSISFDYQKSQWENRNNREEKMYRERSVEKSYDRFQNYERPSYDRHQSYDREYDRQYERQQPPVYEKHYYHPAPQVPQAYYPPPPAYQQQYPFPQPQAPVQSQQADMMNQMFLQFFQKMMSGQLDSSQIQSNDNKQENKVVQESQPQIQEPEPAEIDIKQIQNIEHRIEVVPKACKLNRFKFLVQKAPYQSKILVFTDGRRTNDFLRERLADKIEGYEFVDFNDYKKDPDVGQLIFIHDDDAEGACKLKEVSIMFNFTEPKEFDQYCQRCCLFSGPGKKYSTIYITVREEGKAAKIKEMLQKLEVTNFPESLDKIIEAKAADQSDEEKKVIYDDSFNAIKNEKFGFKLPRGTKKEKKQEPLANNNSGGAWGNNNNAPQSNSGWGGNNNAPQSNNQQNSGWGGNNSAQTNNQSNGASANDNQGWGASTTNNDNQQQSGWGGAAQQTQQPQQDSWGGNNNQAADTTAQDSWGGNNNQPAVNATTDSWGANQAAQTTQETNGGWAQNDNQPQKKVHFEEQQNTAPSGW